MNNNILLTYIVNILPKLTLLFVGILLLYKFYFRIRSKYSIKVNCWFCNTNTKVPYLEANSWTCTNCEQYNGFNKQGDYNREIKAQFECNSSNGLNDTHRWLNESAAQNGFCEACNEAQRLKIEKLAQFEPKRESRFDAELKIYKAELEERYRLCATCDRHLKTVLRNKKKMVLGSKFLEYIMKSAEAFKEPQLQNISLARQILWKRRLSLLITLLTLTNLFCLAYDLPDLNRAWFENVFGVSFGKQIFILCSHVVALWRVVFSFVASLAANGTVTRFGLFARTILMMLLYSLGLRLPQLVRLNFSSLYLLVAPFCILATIFSYNVIDRFKLTRYTILLALWSVYAGGLLEENTSSIQQCWMFIACIVTALLTGTSRVENSPKLFDRTASSFHKIYADDYASDLDTNGSSTLDYQLDCSTLSGRSDISNSYATLKSPTLSPFGRKSPFSTSPISLNLKPRQAMPNSGQQAYGMKSPLSTFSLQQTSLKPAKRQQNNTSFYSADSSRSTLRPRIRNSVLSSTICEPFHATNRSFKQAEQTNSSFKMAHNSFMPTTYAENAFNTHLRHDGRQQMQHRTTHMPAPSLRSVFSASTTALNNIERPSRLISPSRFSSYPNAVGFVSSGNFNAGVCNIFEQAKAFPTQTSFNNLCTINEDISRTSSRSSGFESQIGGGAVGACSVSNHSRENSYGPTEPITNEQHVNKSVTLDSPRSFQPIDYSQLNSGGIDNTFSLLSLQPPLPPISVNCNSPYQSTTTQQRLNLFGPPNLRRGDLLRKWKDDSIVMT